MENFYKGSYKVAGKVYNMQRKPQLIISLILCFLLQTSVFSQTQEEITQAINEGNCEFLFNFVQEPEGKEKRLIENAKQALARYTKRDPATARYRTNKMDSRIRSAGKELTEKVFSDPEQYLPLVVTKLVAGVNDTFQKAKILHDWICYYIYYDADTFFGREYNRQDYISVIKNKKAVCSGYVNLFNKMCSIASIDSIGISGFSKGYGYRGKLDEYPDHDWNAVKIGNKWYLVDVTWDAGYLEYYSYIKGYSTDYLFLDSRPFLYTHLPSDNKYQFYAPILTKEQFEEEPDIPGIFFRYGLELKDQLPLYSNMVDGSFSFDIITRNSNVRLSCQLRTIKQKDIKGGAQQSRSGNIVTFTYDVPDGDDYMGLVFASFNGERRIWERISIDFYEQEIIPELDILLKNKRITEKEKNYFLDSYYKIEYNGYYYFAEDQFSTERNTAVTKIHPLVNLSFNMMGYVLSFNIKRE